MQYLVVLSAMKKIKQKNRIKSKWGAIIDLVARKNLSEEITFQ